MSTLLELTQGLARRGETIHGLRCYPIMHPKPEPPCLCVAGPIRWTYDDTMDGTWHPVFECWVFVNAAHLVNAQTLLFPYLAPSGPQSIPAAIHDDTSLGGAAHDTRVLGGSRPPSVVESVGGMVFGVALEVEGVGIVTLSRPLLSIVIPTVGRPSLERTIRSLRRQESRLHWEAILVGDTHNGTWAHQLPAARDLAGTDSRLRYVDHDGGQHAWGHPQRNEGATCANGHYVAFLGDDDVYLSGALASIHRALFARPEDDPRVHLFRWIAPWKQVLWTDAGFLAQDHIDAECIVCPNVPGRLGLWTSRYQGDYDFIRDTVDRWGGQSRVLWQPEVIAQAQPSEPEDWTLGGREAAPLHLRVEVRGLAVPVRP